MYIQLFSFAFHSISWRLTLWQYFLNAKALSDELYPEVHTESYGTDELSEENYQVS